MAKVKWRQPAHRGSVLPFIDTKHQARVILCASPQAFVALELHCFSFGSKPCIEQELCPHCAAGDIARVVSYAPAHFQPPGQTQWLRGVLPIGNPYGMIAEGDYRGQVLTVQNYKRQDGTYSALKIITATPISAELLKVLRPEWFDIRPRLLQRWGIFDEAAGASQPFFPVSAKAEQDDADILPFKPRVA